MTTGDVQIRIRAKDEVTPVLRRLGWSLWWFQHRDAVGLAAWSLLTFIGGVLFGWVLSA